MNPSTHYDCIVVGGGLCGLTAAYTLHQAGKRVLLLEASEQVGGVIQTTTHCTHAGTFITECGPNTFPNSSTALLELCQALNITPKAAEAVTQNRYLYWRDRLHAVPGNPLQLVGSPLLSLYSKWRILSEPLRSVCSKEEITLADFCRHRLGQEILERVVTPAITGIYAGDPEQLSAQAVFPFLTELEQRHGSLITGMIARARAKKRSALDSKTISTSSEKRSYELLNFASGMQTLPQTLIQALPSDAVHCGQRVFRIEHSEHADQPHYSVHSETTAGEQVVWRGSSLILATPASVSAKLLQSLPTEASALLTRLSYAPIAVVHLGLPKTQLNHPLTGFGFLVPRTENLPLLGCIWTSSLFPDRAPQNVALLSCFIGGAYHPEIVSHPEDDIANQVLNNLRQVFQQPNLSPIFQSVVRWPSAIPQYHLGHRVLIKKIDQQLDTHCPGLFLSGNYRYGVSLNDCVKDGQQAAEKVFPFLEQSTCKIKR